MSYDPEDFISEAEPKLLSLDCFPVFFTPPAPPDYAVIMAAAASTNSNTQYQRVSNEMRQSMETVSSAQDTDAGLLLLDPIGSDDDEDVAPLRKKKEKEHRFSCHPTLVFRLIAIVLLLPSFILFVLSHRPRSLSATIFVCFALVRNILVVLHYVLSQYIRIKIEFRNAAPRDARKKRRCPGLLKSGALGLGVDLVLIVATLITTIISASGAYGWYGRVVVPACMLAYTGNLFYLLSVLDLGMPSNITITGGISFNYGKGRKDDRVQEPLPQVYRDVEASGALGSGASRKTGSDSPIIV